MLLIHEILANVKVVLASSSPQRKKLLEQIGLNFHITPSPFDEETILKSSFENPEEYVTLVAHRKALAVAELLRHEEAKHLVIGADTVIVHNGRIIGKPHTADVATSTLQELNNRSHAVCTGVSLIKVECGELTSKQFKEVTKVKFGDLTNDEILGYVKSGEPLNKAGAYGIQGLGAVLVESIEGDYNNVVGFPIHRFCREVETFLKDEKL